ncbi:hypothetical protein GW17_00029788 [Ensete ventricosum]|nr:hypothetical protein GW17_00029788 [Ensete ventricosum]
MGRRQRKKKTLRQLFGSNAAKHLCHITPAALPFRIRQRREGTGETNDRRWIPPRMNGRPSRGPTMLSISGWHILRI